MHVDYISIYTHQINRLERIYFKNEKVNYEPIRHRKICIIKRRIIEKRYNRLTLERLLINSKLTQEK